MIDREISLPPYRFWERRGGSGTPIVLIHGLGGSSDWWRRNFDALAESHLVVAVDLIGFGRNRFFLRRSSLPLTFVEIAALLVRWLRESFDQPVHLAGNSMGGHIAIHVAGTHPDLVRSLTLVNSSGIPFEIAPGRHLSNLIVPRGALSFATILARDAFRSGPTSVAVAFARLLRDDARPLLRSLAMPVLLLWGETDPLVPLTYAEQMKEIIPNAKLVVVPNAGHIPMWENAEAFNRALLTFVSSVERSSSAASGAPLFTWGLSGWTDGIAHREAGTRRDIVLIHGLGMSSKYFQPLARALFARGWNPIAPDLPGFGESLDGPAAGEKEHAALLRKWAETLGIRDDAVWVGHSIGCNVVAEMPQRVMIGPLWTHARHPMLRMMFMLTLDAFREPLRLYGYIIPAYWRTGFARWWKTFRRYTFNGAPPDALMLCGTRDPLPDRACVKVIEVPGAHACNFSHAEELAEAISRRRPSSALPQS